MQLETLYCTFAAHPEGQWIMGPQNAQLLFQFVKEHPIRNVLDLGLGIGCSASVVALAFQEKKETEYHIDSVEQSDKCIQIAEALVPPDLKGHMTFHKANPVIWRSEQMPHQVFSVYDTLPEGNYDLIVNDGPGPFLDGGYWLDFPNGTIQKILNRIGAGTFVVFDGRLVSLSLLERYYSDNFYLVHQSRNFNVVERKNNPVQFKDNVLAVMREQTTYFNENK